MLGTEGELGHWDMPETLSNDPQKTNDNFATLGNTMTLLRGLKELRKQNPQQKITFTRDGETIHPGKTVRLVWEGMAAGALNELGQEGLEEEADEMMKTVANFQNEGKE